MQDGGKPTGADSIIPHSNEVDTNRRVVQLKGYPTAVCFRNHQHSSMMGMVSLGIINAWVTMPHRKRVGNTVTRTVIADASVKFCVIL
jgi:hypothetical protein